MFGYSKYYVDNLSENVKRGNRTKINKGWMPNKAPIGYLNDRATGTIVVDPERAPLVQKLFSAAMVPGTTLRELAEKANSWHLTTTPSLRSGGKVIGRSAIHRMLNNPFYIGQIPWGGILYQGAHTALITHSDFIKVRQNIGRKGKQSYRKNSYKFTGLMTCGECGMSITAEKQINRHGRSYVYYRCTKKKSGYKCMQKYLREEELQNEFANRLIQLSIPDKIFNVLKVIFKTKNNGKLEEHHKIQNGLINKISLAEKALSNIVALRAKEHISELEFLKQKKELQFEILKYKEELDKPDSPRNWLESLETVFLFRNRAIYLFNHGSDKIKRAMIKIMCSNPQLIDQRVSFHAKKPFLILSNLQLCPVLRGDVNVIRISCNDEHVEGGKESCIDASDYMKSLFIHYKENMKEYKEVVKMIREFESSPEYRMYLPQMEEALRQAPSDRVVH